ncbi:MAG: hypothetical protein HYX71_12520 [Opitutae bacterium]|nr:hypothetical protein [Opitutae bacterium]
MDDDIAFEAGPVVFRRGLVLAFKYLLDFILLRRDKIIEPVAGRRSISSISHVH